jgi:hypothetical protein
VASWRGVSGTVYATRKGRGFAPWKPSAAHAQWVGVCQGIIEDYQPHWPITPRQLLYIGMGRGHWSKKDGEKIVETVTGRGRRAGLIPWEAIRDERSAAVGDGGFDGVKDFVRYVAGIANNRLVDFWEGQPAVVELWVEANGMIPQVSRIAHPYGVTVYSGGGFNTIGAKHEAAERFVARDARTVVLHVGDLDPHGVSIFDALADDITEFFIGDAWNTGDEPDFVRVAVTREQVEEHELPAEDVDPGKVVGMADWSGGAVQAEALDPPVLAEIVRQAIESHINLDVLAQRREDDDRARAEVRAWIEGREKAAAAV